MDDYPEPDPPPEARCPWSAMSEVPPPTRSVHSTQYSTRRAPTLPAVGVAVSAAALTMCDDIVRTSELVRPVPPKNTPLPTATHILTIELCTVVCNVYVIHTYRIRTTMLNCTVKCNEIECVNSESLNQPLQQQTVRTWRGLKLFVVCLKSRTLSHERARERERCARECVRDECVRPPRRTRPRCEKVLQWPTPRRREWRLRC